MTLAASICRAAMMGGIIAFSLYMYLKSRAGYSREGRVFLDVVYGLLALAILLASIL